MNRWRSPFCPVCFRTMGNKAATIPGSNIKFANVNQWGLPDQLEGQLKPFGVVMSSEGRGTMKFEGHYDVDEDIEGFFPLIKARLLGAVTDWLRRGWLTAADLQGVISTPAAASVKKVRKKKATE